MELKGILLAALIGYLSGSISYARLVAAFAAPRRNIAGVTIQIPGTEEFVESDVISATTVRMNVGPRWGCLVGILDILKAAIPALAFRLWQPDQPYYLIAAFMASVGHVWPVWYRFVGGRGLSPVLGGFLVLDPLGTLLTNLAGFLFGVLPRNMLVITSSGILFMIPWIWFTTHDPAKLMYVILADALYYYSMIPELKIYVKLQKEGNWEAFSKSARLKVILPDGSERYDTATLTSFFQAIRERLHRARSNSGRRRA